MSDIVQRLREYHAEECAHIATLGEAADLIESLQSRLSSAQEIADAALDSTLDSNDIRALRTALEKIAHIDAAVVETREPTFCLQAVPTMPDGEPEPCMREAKHDGECDPRLPASERQEPFAGLPPDQQGYAGLPPKDQLK